MNDEGRTRPSFDGVEKLRILDRQIRYGHDHSIPTSGSDFVTDMWDVFDELGNLLLDKHADYGPTNVSRSPGGPLNGLRVRIWDKIARINHLLDQGASPRNESLRDSFVDLANYAAIAVMVLDNKWPEK